MKIGFIQVVGIGDILIAIPIARWFMRQGHEIVWPIRNDFLGFYNQAVPDINFTGIDPKQYPGHVEFHYARPLEMLQQAGCDRIYTLFNYLRGFDHPDAKRAEMMTLDAYKYAVTGCPLSEKWTLALTRDMGREKALYNSLNITRPYIVIHSRGIEHLINPQLPPHWLSDYQIIHISPLTDSPFDWIYTLENAAKLVILESMYSNLIELLDIKTEKYLMIHSPAAWTPVYKSDWMVSVALQPVIERP